MKAYLAITPFSPKTNMNPSFSDERYSSDEYQHFLESVTEESLKLDVTVSRVTPTLGVWQGRYEPSTLITLEGSQIALNQLSYCLGAMFNQESVRLVSSSPAGPNLTYTYSTEVKPSQTVSQLVKFGVDGARLTRTTIQIDTHKHLDSTLSILLEEAYGEPHVSSCELNVITFK